MIFLLFWNKYSLTDSVPTNLGSAKKFLKVFGRGEKKISSPAGIIPFTYYFPLPPKSLVLNALELTNELFYSEATKKEEQEAPQPQ